MGGVCTSMSPPPPPHAEMDVTPSSATSSDPTVVTTGIYHPPPPGAPPSLVSSEPIPLFPETSDADGYNPEAPSLTNTSRPMCRASEHAQRPNLTDLASGDMDLLPRGPPPPPPAEMDVTPSSATSSDPTVVTTGIYHPPPPGAPPSLVSSEPIPLFPETSDADGYNPEAPSLTNTSRPMCRASEHAQRPNLTDLASGDMDLLPRGPPPPPPAEMDVTPSSATSSDPTVVTTGIYHPPPPGAPPSLVSSEPIPLFPETSDADGYNPEAPSLTNTSRPMYRHRVHAQRPNLTGLASGDMDLLPREKPDNNNMRIVVDSDSRKRNPTPADTGIPLKKPCFDKPNFNRINAPGFKKKVVFGNGNTKLELRRIPPELNNISKLNEHFSKFGTLVNLQVAYAGDPERALIQFATHAEAKKAISSTEEVLNNRFIKMYWHREGLAQQTQAPNTPKTVTKVPIKERLGFIAKHTPATTEKTVTKVPIKERLGFIAKYTPATTEKTVTKVPIKERLGFIAKYTPATTEKTVTKVPIKERLGFIAKYTPATNEKVLSTSTGLTKTVYNPEALKAIQKSVTYLPPLDNTDALKKKQMLIKNKNMKAEDKAEILKTLETLTVRITKLRDELKAVTPAGNALKINKSKAQMQKELLDAELDLHKKLQAGEDVVELRRKYTELQLEAARRGILSSGRGRGTHMRGRGMSRGRGRGRGVPVHAVVDHRPKALEISGFCEGDRGDLLPHFAQFGEIEDCQINDTSLRATIAFRTRAEAEAAAVHGAHFKGQDLKLAWSKPVANPGSAEVEDVEQEEEEFPEENVVDDSLLQDDDEEEEDNESRSWRR